jgi:outer membrane protein OmpA-like peptidoglycan-associated protein
MDLKSVYFLTIINTILIQIRNWQLIDLRKIFIDYPDTDILIEGHTDNVGSKSYNNSLSQRRALAVSTALTNEGVNSSRIKTKWYGESQPIVENNSAENRASNRRVEFVITANEKMKAAAKNAIN